jgi:ABC-type tungstate transport system permease subunit
MSFPQDNSLVNIYAQACYVNNKKYIITAVYLNARFISWVVDVKFQEAMLREARADKISNIM